LSAGGGGAAIGLGDGDRPTVAMEALRVTGVHAAIVHVAIGAGDTRHGLGVGDADATSSGDDVVAEMIGMGKTQVAMALSAELGRVRHDLILCRGGIEIGGGARVMGIVTSSAGHMRPGVGVRGGGAGGEKSVAGGEKVAQGSRLTHAAVGQHGSRGMTRDAVFALGDGGRSLARVRAAQFAGDRGLGVGMFAGRPGVVNQVISVGEAQIPMALSAELALVVHESVLGRPRVEGREAGRIVHVVRGHVMASGAGHMRPGGGVRGGGVGGE